MKPIETLDISLRRSGGINLIHDSRADVRALMQCFNILAGKVNELVIANNELQQKLASASNAESESDS